MSKLGKVAQFFLGKKQDYRRVLLGDRDGERVLNDILRECQMDRDPIVPNDPLSTGERIGRQNIGRFLANNLHLPDDEIIRRANSIDKEDYSDDDTQDEGLGL